MARKKAITAAENRMDKLLLIYRDRDSIKKSFRILKTDLDIFPKRKRKESTIRGTIFVFFLSLIIRTAIIRGMISSGPYEEVFPGEDDSGT